MRIIKPSALHMENNTTPYKFIEKVGRTCYKSEDRITDGSAEKFVAGLVKSRHLAMLEHETLYFVTSKKFLEDFLDDMRDYNEPLKYFNITCEYGDFIISGSFRSFLELFEHGYYSHPMVHVQHILQSYFSVVFGELENKDKEKYTPDDCVLYTRGSFIKLYEDRPRILFKHLTHTFLFVCDRGVSHEFVRHRVASFAQESTRYCNYAKDKFGNEITVIDPCFWEGENSAYPYEEWKDQCESAERSYFRLLDMGATPQEARTVLPNSLKTEIIITTTEEEWQHIVNLRYIGTTGAPHPQMKEAMGYAIADLVIATQGRVNLDREVK